MKIFEIDDQDRLWADLNNISFDIEKYFNRAKTILDMLIALKSSYRNKIWIPTIEEIEDKLLKILNANLADDQSTKDVKEKAKQYLTEIAKLKGLL